LTQNPYKYTGPLDPVNDKNICVPRLDDIKRVIGGIKKGEYWAILGPRHVGKTTFLRQIQHRYTYSNHIFLYFNFKDSPSNEEKLYQRLIDKFMGEIPGDKPKNLKNRWKDEGPNIRFFYFLEKFTPKAEIQKIILLFDDIDNIPSLDKFLRVWRNLYHKRFLEKKLEKYALILTGSKDLIEETIGETSPFNIAEILKLKDFSHEESMKLIEKPMKQLNIKIDPEAKAYLLSQVSGHPQLLQQACYILADRTYAANKSITKKDAEEVKKVLFKENQNLNMLENDLKSNDTLRKLLKDILKGKKIIYHPKQAFSFWGVGPIKEQDPYCTIRNPLYEEIIKRNRGF
jgi:predicted AAA+ superfamily ATPase